MKRFGLIGAAGYIAPRHMRAIADTGNVLAAALDPSDSVGVIDSYFPDASFFVEFERFDRHLDLLRREDEAVDFVSICSPNYLHDSHIRFALRSGASAICEKPLVLNPWNIDGLREVERESGSRVYSILQLRLHPAVNELAGRVKESPLNTKFDVDLTYIAGRGRWYDFSWKGDEEKSGGIATNIGIHLFDMLYFVFGNLQENVVHHSDAHTAAGYLEYERARVRWFLSIDASHIPGRVAEAGVRTYRSIRVGEDKLDFTEGFSDLHTTSYREILAGKGFGIDESRVAIETVAAIRESRPNRHRGECHPLLAQLEHGR